MTFQPVRDARLAWERTQPQLFFELAEVSDPMGGRDYTPQLRPGLRQPHNTTGDSRSIHRGTRGCLRQEAS